MGAPHTVNTFYSLFLISIGIISFGARYIAEGDLQFTALIPVILGIILFPFSGAMEKDKHVFAHIAVAITLVIAIGMTFMFVREFNAATEVTRKMIVFGLITVVSYFAVVLYVFGFFERKKELKKNENNGV